MSLNQADLDSRLSYLKQGFMAHYQEEPVKMQHHAGRCGSGQFTMLLGVLAAYLYWLVHILVPILFPQDMTLSNSLGRITHNTVRAAIIKYTRATISMGD